MADLDTLKEKLAAIEHERWSDWQKWMHEVLRKSGELTEGADEILQRWDKQIITPYAGLSDQEKASDMEQVDRYWPLIEAYVNQIVSKELEVLHQTIDFEYWENPNKELTRGLAWAKAAIMARVEFYRGKENE